MPLPPTGDSAQHEQGGAKPWQDLLEVQPLVRTIPGVQVLSVDQDSIELAPQQPELRPATRLARLLHRFSWSSCIVTTELSLPEGS